jgi:phosphoribosylaminoimidazole-succinocarboxamide synthase
LEGRSMLVKRAEMFPVECVVRGYISGSGWKDYQQTGSVCGIRLPSGLRESDKLPEPIFTPAAKNNVGHDENISFQKMVDIIGQKPAEDLRDLTIKIYERASQHAGSKGVILADTKFEFGLIDGKITLADEVLTPDSSRYWPAETYKPGGAQPSFDKQYVRDYLESIRWNKQAPAPGLPLEVVEKTKAKYLEAFRLITSRANL